MDLRDQHVVVTGGAGALGTAVVSTLIEAGATFAANNFTDPRIFELIETRLKSGAKEGAEA